MSYSEPAIPTMTLKGLDSKIQIIQGKMLFSWLEKSFGLADRIVEMREEKPYIFPATFEGNFTDPVSLMPSDEWSSFCFWTHGDAKFDLLDNFPPKLPLVIYPVSCIFYMDISKIKGGTYKESKSDIIEDIFNFSNNVKVAAQLVPTKFIEGDITKVYEGFTLRDEDNKWQIYPRWSCRMDFELSFRYDCYEGISIT